MLALFGCIFFMGSVQARPGGERFRPPVEAKPLSLVATPKEDSSVVGFTSEASKTQFLRRNNLQPGDLRYSPKLRAYKVPKPAAEVVPTTGTSVEPDPVATISAVTPNDSLYSGQYALPAMKLPDAWTTSTGSASTVIAVIDTGFALSHQDLQSKWWSNTGEVGATSIEGITPNCTSRGLSLNKSCNNLDDDTDGYIDNYQGWNFIAGTNNVTPGAENPNGTGVMHGTLTASEAAAATNNNLGIAGTCWSCKIMPLKAMNDNGTGSSFDIAAAIRYAADHGASVINLSLGVSTSSGTMQSAVNYALGKGVVLVAAAGNDGVNSIEYPAAYSGVVSVGATTSSNTVAPYSNLGSGLTVLAPGTNITSAGWSSGNQVSAYYSASGTSMASALVSGVVGVLRTVSPTASTTAISNALKTSPTSISTSVGAKPLVDATAALGALGVSSSGTTPSQLLPLYRFWSPVFSNDHFYTTSVIERNALLNDRNWRYESVGFNTADCASPGVSNVYRFWSPRFQNAHFFTMSTVERDALFRDANWRYEGVGFCAAADSSTNGAAVYRFWSPAYHDVHFYTQSVAERDAVMRDPAWRYEGVAFYAW